jgi:hypothetical protein
MDGEITLKNVCGVETKLLDGFWLLAKQKCLRWIHAYVVQF